MTTVTMLITSAFLELIFEGVVDAHALDIEFKNGIDLEDFWKMWGANAAAFWGVTLADSVVSITIMIWAFKQIPTAAFCTSSTDPCSCEGGGFEIYAPFCNAALFNYESNETTSGASTSNVTTVKDVQALQAAKTEFPSIFDALAGKITVILVSVGVVVLVVVVFTFARVCASHSR